MLGNHFRWGCGPTQDNVRNKLRKDEMLVRCQFIVTCRYSVIVTAFCCIINDDSHRQNDIRRHLCFSARRGQHKNKQKPCIINK
jgi:hypothetical protein